MAHAILMPKPGQMTEECTVVSWHKKEGDPVKRGDVLFEIETDKSTMEVEAFDDGVLLKIVAPEGAVVPVNTVCAYVGEPGEAIPEAAPAAAVVRTPPPPVLESVPARSPAIAPAGRQPRPESTPARSPAAGPAVGRSPAAGPAVGSPSTTSWPRSREPRLARRRRASSRRRASRPPVSSPRLPRTLRSRSSPSTGKRSRDRSTGCAG
jgi:pyruvate/2-oxoglutarate dehydrogenase complex dihydrolipoamide acyltransferase (E2) component